MLILKIKYKSIRGEGRMEERKDIKRSFVVLETIIELAIILIVVAVIVPALM